MDGPRPSSVAAPSIWYAAVATPHRKSAGNAGMGSVTGSVSHRGAVRTGFGTRDVPSLRVAPDRLTAPVPWPRLDAHLVAAPAQRLDRPGAQLRFDVQPGAGLPVPARWAQGRLRVQPTVHSGHDELDVALWLHVPAHHAERSDRLPVAGEEAGDDGVVRAFAAPDLVRVAGFQAEAGAPVLQPEPVPGQGDVRAEAQEVGLDQADHRPVGVGRTQVDGAAPARLAGHRQPAGPAPPGPPRGGVLRKQD